MRVKTEAKRQAILEVASQVFLETGYERTSMGEISSRLGGSKGTLYNYFASKEALFVAVTLQAGQQHVARMFAALESNVGKLQTRLLRFGEDYIHIVFSPDFMSARRTVIAEAGRTDIGRRFYDAGPGPGQARIGALLKVAMDAGQLRKDDPVLATRQLIALLGAETLDECTFVLGSSFTPTENRRMVRRAVSAFMAIYAVPDDATAMVASGDQVDVG